MTLHQLEARLDELFRLYYTEDIVDGYYWVTTDEFIRHLNRVGRSIVKELQAITFELDERGLMTEEIIEWHDTKARGLKRHRLAR
jgi:hypothetical protein